MGARFQAAILGVAAIEQESGAMNVGAYRRTIGFMVLALLVGALASWFVYDVLVDFYAPRAAF